MPQVVLSLDGALYSVGLVDGASRRIPLPNGCIGGPAVTADGRWLACGSESGIIVTSPAATSVSEATVVLPSLGGTPTWSPDGLHLAVFTDHLSCSLGLYATTPAHHVFRQTAVLSFPFLLNASQDSGPSPICLLQGLSWSPDGTRLAIVDINEGPGPSDLYLLPFAALPATILTGQSEPVMVTVAQDAVRHIGSTWPYSLPMPPPAWAPNGRSLTYISGDGVTIRQFTPASQAQTTLLALPQIRVTLIALAWTPDGRQLLFAVGGGASANCGLPRSNLYQYAPPTT